MKCAKVNSAAQSVAALTLGLPVLGDRIKNKYLVEAMNVVDGFTNKDEIFTENTQIKRMRRRYDLMSELHPPRIREAISMSTSAAVIISVTLGIVSLARHFNLTVSYPILFGASVLASYKASEQVSDFVDSVNQSLLDKGIINYYLSLPEEATTKRRQIESFCETLSIDLPLKCFLT